MQYNIFWQGWYSVNKIKIEYHSTSLATLDFLTHRRRAATFCVLGIFRKKLLARSMTPILQILWQIWPWFCREIPIQLGKHQNQMWLALKSSICNLYCFWCRLNRASATYWLQYHWGIYFRFSALHRNCVRTNCNSSHVVGFAGPHLGPWHKDLEQSGSESRCARSRNLPKQLSRRLLFYGWSTLATSQSVTVFFYVFLQSILINDHDWSTVERVYQVHVFQRGLKLREKGKTNRPWIRRPQ